MTASKQIVMRVSSAWTPSPPCLASLTHMHGVYVGHARTEYSGDLHGFREALIATRLARSFTKGPAKRSYTVLLDRLATVVAIQEIPSAVNGTHTIAEHKEAMAEYRIALRARIVALMGI